MTSVMAAAAPLNTRSVPGRIIIRGTSKISLKDRFAKLNTDLQQYQSTSRSNDAALSAANKRLARELGNRPELMATPQRRQRSALERLGVKARLGIPIGIRQRGYHQQWNGFTPYRRRNFGTGSFAYTGNAGYRRPRFDMKRLDNGNFGSPSGFRFGRGGFRNRFRGAGWRMGPGGRVTGGIGKGGPRKEGLSKEELDRQLDEYMSKTKARLDDELDMYMGETTM